MRCASTADASLLCLRIPPFCFAVRQRAISVVFGSRFMSMKHGVPCVDPVVRVWAILCPTLGTFVVMSIKKRPFFLPQHLTSSFRPCNGIFIVSTLQQSSRFGTAGFPAEIRAHIANAYNKKSPGLKRPGLDGCGAECNLFASGI